MNPGTADFKIVVCNSHDRIGAKYKKTLANGRVIAKPKCAVKKEISCFINKPEGNCTLSSDEFQLDKYCYTKCDKSHEEMLASGLV